MFDVDFSTISNALELKCEFISNLNLKLNSRNLNILYPIIGKIQSTHNNINLKLDTLSIYNQIKAKNQSKKALLNAFVIFTEEYYRFYNSPKTRKTLNTNNMDLEIDDFIEIYQSIFNRTAQIAYNEDTKLISVSLYHKFKRQSSLKTSGSYYTPKILTDFMIDNSLLIIQDEKHDYIKKNKVEIEDYILKLIQKSEFKITILYLKHLLSIKIIDLSIGVGVFLISSIPLLIKIIRKLSDQLYNIISKIKLTMNKSENDIRKFKAFFSIIENELSLLSDNLVKIRSSNLLILNFIIENCFYGIDIDENAVKLSKLFILMELGKNLSLQKVEIKETEIIKLNDYNIKNEFMNIKCKNSLISQFSCNLNDNQRLEIAKLNGIVWDELYPEIFHRKEIKFSQGFDIIIGNPPWEILKPNDREFFNNYDIGFISLTRKEQDIRKNDLLKNTQIKNNYNKYIADLELQLKIIDKLGFFKNQGAIVRGRRYTGDPQQYKLFLELANKLIINNGIISLVVQHNFLGSKGCSGLRKFYIEQGKFEGIWEFYNKTEGFTFFDNIDLKQRFILFLYKKTRTKSVILKYKKGSDVESLNTDFSDFESIDIALLQKFSPEEMQILTFSDKINKSIFTKLSKFLTISNFGQKNLTDLNGLNDLTIKLSQDLHVTRHRNIIVKYREKTNKNEKDKKNERNEKTDMIPVIGGKNIAPFYTSKNTAKNFVLLENIDDRLKKAQEKYSLICRNILPNSAKRLIFSYLKSGLLMDNSCTRISIKLSNETTKNVNEKPILLYLLAIFNSFIVEYYLKTFLTGINLNYYLIERIPIPEISENNMNLFNKIVDCVNRLISKEKNKNEKNNKEKDRNQNWIEVYEEIEILVAYLYKLTYKEFNAVLNTFNFNKLSKTRFSGILIYENIKKTRLLEKYEKILRENISNN